MSCLVKYLKRIINIPSFFILPFLFFQMRTHGISLNVPTEVIVSTDPVNVFNSRCILTFPPLYSCTNINMSQLPKNQLSLIKGFVMVLFCCIYSLLSTDTNCKRHVFLTSCIGIHVFFFKKHEFKKHKAETCLG